MLHRVPWSQSACQLKKVSQHFYLFYMARAAGQISTWLCRFSTPLGVNSPCHTEICFGVKGCIFYLHPTASVFSTWQEHSDGQVWSWTLVRTRTVLNRTQNRTSSSVPGSQHWLNWTWGLVQSLANFRKIRTRFERTKSEINPTFSKWLPTWSWKWVTWLCWCSYVTLCVDSVVFGSVFLWSAPLCPYGLG